MDLVMQNDDDLNLKPAQASYAVIKASDVLVAVD